MKIGITFNPKNIFQIFVPYEMYVITFIYIKACRNIIIHIYAHIYTQRVREEDEKNMTTQ